MNWYAVCTLPQKEKKIASLLTKKGIDSFCPTIQVIEKGSINRKSIDVPLFSRFVFVQISEFQEAIVKSISGVVNFLFWKTKPALISNDEIDVIKNLTLNYSNIRLEKCTVELGGDLKILENPHVSYNANTISVKYNHVKVLLPSLGYIICAEHQSRVVEPTVYTSKQQNSVANVPALVYN